MVTVTSWACSHVASLGPKRVTISHIGTSSPLSHRSHLPYEAGTRRDGVRVVLSSGSGSHRLGMGTAAAAASPERAKGGYFVSRLESVWYVVFITEGAAYATLQVSSVLCATEWGCVSALSLTSLPRVCVVYTC
jgi:hypothetical protein